MLQNTHTQKEVIKERQNSKIVRNKKGRTHRC